VLALFAAFGCLAGYGSVGVRLAAGCGVTSQDYIFVAGLLPCLGGLDLAFFALASVEVVPPWSRPRAVAAVAYEGMMGR
jgi:hypothetical protein